MLKRLQEKAGFVTLETIVVTGVVIALAVYALSTYNGVVKLTLDDSLDKLAAVMTDLDIPVTP